MQSLTVTKEAEIATVVIARGKVNALERGVVEELRQAFDALRDDPGVRAVILTGSGRFFSFGFDIPLFLSFGKEEFADYVHGFTRLYTDLFQYPKPVVAALNGHTVAGGCMLALACDHRVMARGNAKIALNEVAFGSSVFAGSVEMLRFWVGSANATTILYSGAMLSAEEALGLGLVHQAEPEDRVMPAAAAAASTLGAKPPAAFASIKALLRRPIVEHMVQREDDSVREFVDIWYSEATRANLRNITIR